MLFFFFLSTCAFAAYFLFRFVVFFLFFSRPYLSPFFSVCVFLLCHLRDSVHILAAFSTIIFPFVVLCFYCLLLFFVVVFFFLFFRVIFLFFFFISMVGLCFSIEISFLLVILVRRIYMRFFCFHQSTIFFYPEEK